MKKIVGMAGALIFAGAFALTIALPVSAGPTDTYTLKVSTKADRSGAVDLNGTTQKGNIYVFTSPNTSDIKRVGFWLDNPSMSGSPKWSESVAPYDFAGGSTTAANPFDTTKISEGSHSIQAKISYNDGTPVKSLSSSFRVANSATPPPPTSPTISDGAYIDGAPYDPADIDAFASLSGRRPKHVLFFHGDYENFNTSYHDPIHARGATPVLTYQPTQTLLRDTATGTQDAFWTEWAKRTVTYGKPYYFRYAHEMNSKWFYWSIGVNGNTAADYRAAWRRIHDIFEREGANQYVTWVWCPNVSESQANLDSLASIYPGDAYVDWVGIDGYNWGTGQPWGSRWQTFTEVFGRTYDKLVTIAPNKPFWISETGSTESGGDKAAWIRSAYLSEIPSTRFNKIKAITYFHTSKEADWRINTSESSRLAYKESIADASS